MEELNLIYGNQALDKYFNTLLKVGYTSNKNTHEALIYTFITNCFLVNKFPTLNNIYKNEMLNALNCIYKNSCTFNK